MDKRIKISKDYDKKIKNALIQIHLYFGVKYIPIKDKGQSTDNLLHARRLSIYFLKRFSYLSSAQIADYLGYNEQSTMLYHNRKIRDWLSNGDTKIIKWVSELTPIVEFHFKRNKTSEEKKELDINTIEININKLNNIELNKLKNLLHLFAENTGYTDIDIDRSIAKVDRNINFKRL